MKNSKTLNFLKNNNYYTHAESCYYKAIDEIRSNYKSYLEIGGGKNPLFDPSKEYTVNDISSHELSFIESKGYVTANFDICGDFHYNYNEKYDFIFSKMVLEHVSDGNRYYQNIYKLLKPGGICITYHPTLFSLPFVINKILPNSIGEKLFDFLYGKNKTRVREKIRIGKFPAYYSYCYSTKNNLNLIKKIGLKTAYAIPFYGHHYYKKIKFLYFIHKIFSNIIRNLNFKFLSSYCYTIVKK